MPLAVQALVILDSEEKGIHVLSRAAALATIWAFPSFSDAQTTFQGIGFLPGDSDSIATGVSGDGSVVVGDSAPTSFAHRRVFRWTASNGMENLGTLGGDHSEGSDDSGGISADGSVIAGYSLARDGHGHAYRWVLGEDMTDLGKLPGGYESRANDVNADGSVVVGYSSTEGGGEYRAFRWTNELGMVNLGTLPGGSFSFARAVSDDGHVVVGSANVATAARAFRWTNDEGMQSLGTLSGGNGSAAYGTSADGSIIVGLSDSAPPTDDRAFRWTAATGMECLGILPGSESYSAATAITPDGGTIVGYSDSAHGEAPFIWTEAGGMRNLRTMLVAEHGIDLRGWCRMRPRSISSDARTIVGEATNPAGQREGWIVVLGDPVDGYCPADWDRDGFASGPDFDLYVQAFESGSRLADFDGDCFVTGADFDAFVQAFESGC